MDTKRTATDWALFATLTVIWALAYAFTRIAVDKDDPSAGLPVEWVLVGRLTIGAVFLISLALVWREKFPPLSDRRRRLTIVAMGLVGSAMPFFLITTAQQTVNSSLAALYTAASPIFVAIGANIWFADEKMTPRRWIGVLIGFAGVAVLFGPDAIKGFGSVSMFAQILLVVATLGYAAATLIARGAPPMPSIMFAAAFVSTAAIVSWPFALMRSSEGLTITWHHWAAVAGLGLGSSGIGQVLYMVLVRRAGATFLSLVGYCIPVVSAIIGWFAFGETQSWNAVLAFALILGGVWLASRKPSAVKPPIS